MVMRVFILAFVLLLAPSAFSRPTYSMVDYAYLEPLIFLEQTMNAKYQNVSVFESITDAVLPNVFRPENRRYFDLFTVLVPVEEAVIINTTGQDLQELIVNRDGREYVKFFVHPQSRDYYKNRLP